MNLDYLSNFVTNDLSSFSNNIKYSLMIGLEPSKGARSPKLWNACGDNSSNMICVDIPNEAKLIDLFNYIENESIFIGGAVTAPYKSKWFDLCKHSTEYANSISACNSFYRSEDGKFVCDNTDGKGFLKSLSNLNNSKKIERFLIFGAGGVGKAVASTLSIEFNNVSEIIWLSRNLQNMIPLKGVENSTYDKYKLQNNNSGTCLINCTSLGDYTNPQNSIVDSESIALKIIENYKIESFFDCIHTPPKTKLIKLLESQCKTSNGIDMNIFQAVYGYNNVHHDSFENILSTMKKYAK